MLLVNGVVAVKYKSKYNDEFCGNEYNYFTDVPLKVGMIVNAPTKYGTSLAKVVKENVDPLTIPLNIRNAMRTIKPDDVVKEEKEETEFYNQLTL